MSTSTPEQPREADGKFSEKEGTPPEVTLSKRGIPKEIAEFEAFVDLAVGRLAAEAVGQDAVAEQLQQDACHVAVGLFQLIEEQDAVGAAADLLRERAARIVADVARRRAEQARDARRLHILRHIHPDERVRAAVDDLRELFT